MSRDPTITNNEKLKLHKEGIPWRLVGYHLQPIVNEIPSYVKDTRGFLRKLDKTEYVPNGSYPPLDTRSKLNARRQSEDVLYIFWTSYAR